MFKHGILGLFTTFAIVLAGCSSNPPYTPASVQPVSIDTTAYAPKVTSFVVILDTSSSMGEDYQERPRIQTAQDLVASFNSTVPPMDFQAGLVTFGKDTGRCFGQGTATAAYGLTTYKPADFATALGSLECAGGTTPMSDGIDATTQLLSAESGMTAVILVSDFQWVNAKSVMSAASQLKAQHADKLCLHTVKVGDNTTGDALIASLNQVAGCDSAMQAGDIASTDAMANFVTEVLLAPLEYEEHAVSASALFDFDKAILKQQGKAELHNLDEYIKSKGLQVVDINIIGHTDSVGSAEYNQGLSERRAMAVKEYMVSEGIDAGIIDVSGDGEANPVASNDTDEGRALNRRVEIHVGTKRAIN
jgi:OOP family OmpA-OmpF porin